MMKRNIAFFWFILLVCIVFIFLYTFRTKNSTWKTSGVIPLSDRLSQQICKDVKSANELTYQNAIEIAQKGNCGLLEGSLVFSENYTCNEDTGTWWVDVRTNPEKKGCNPACVVNLENKKAEINWRCTGLIVQ